MTSVQERANLVRARRILAALPERSAVELGDVGTVVLATAGLSALGAAAREVSHGDVVLGVSNGLERGRLVIEGALARRVVARALRLGDGAGVLAPLGQGERGLVAGLVAGVLEAGGASLFVGLSAPAEPVNAGAVFALHVTAAGAHGWARLEVPSGWLRRVTPRVSDAVLAAPEVEIAVELARTTLGADEVAALEPGDAIVFDGEPSLRAAIEREVRVVLGDHVARARLRVDGSVTLEQGLELPPEFVEDGARVAAGSPGRPADRAPREIVAELGRLRVRGAEVAAFGAGVVISLERLPGFFVTLCVGEQTHVEGQLVEVDGALAVRVTAVRGTAL